MRVVVLDTETTGWVRNLPLDDPRQPHLVQLGVIVADTERREVVSSIDIMVRPEGWEIPDRVVKVHGISEAKANVHGISERLATELLVDLWGGSRMIAHNANFDHRILSIAMARYQPKVIQDRWAGTERLCTMEESVRYVKKKKKEGRTKYQNPSLGEAYKHFTGRAMKSAHSAYPDADACMHVLWGILDQQPGM